MKVKIKTIELDLQPCGVADPKIIDAVVAQAWLAAVRKAWTPLITALLAANLPTDDLPDLISSWASTFSLGDRSKKQDATARKLAKTYVEEKLKAGRYSITEARERGLIAQSVEDIFASEDKGCFVEEAAEALEPADLLDPLPVTMEELEALRKRKEES